VADGRKHLPLIPKVACSNPAIESSELMPNLKNSELMSNFNPNAKNLELMPKLNLKHFEM
jgi:hypothetical protein